MHRQQHLAVADMCGIFGYYNYKISRDRRAILELLFTGLRRLEYRGYDSAGISVDADDLLQQAELGQPGYSDTANGSSANIVGANGSPADLGRRYSCGIVAAVPLVIKSQVSRLRVPSASQQ